MTEPAPLLAACDMLGITTDQLWVDYLAMGGDLMIDDLHDFLQGRRTIPDIDYDRLAQTINDRFIELGQDHPLAYADE